jgi:predicted nucleotidyltransferase
MRTVGIIVEYNPLHNGHLYHLQQAKLAAQADAVIAVMSGDFLQRGEPAIVSKWARTEMAIQAGVDLVIELPSRYATSAAERFAYGAIRTLDATGIVDYLCFGSEHGDISPFLTLAEQIETESSSFKETLAAQLQLGVSYPTAYANTIQTICQTEQLQFDASQPNNTLGLFYVLALLRIKSSIQPLTIQRIASAYADQEPSHASIASATALRNAILKNTHAIDNYVPASTLRILQREFATDCGPITWDSLYPSLLHQLATLPTQQLKEIHDVQEGLENRLKQAIYAMDVSSFANLIDTLSTKRYTRTHLQRVLTNVLLNRTSADVLPYIRVLGFTAKGQQLLKKMRHTAKAPLISRVTKSHFQLLEEDLKASYIHTLGYPAPSRDQLRRELIQRPITCE